MWCECPLACAQGTLAPVEYDGLMCAAAAMWSVATIAVAAGSTSSLILHACIATYLNLRELVRESDW